MSGENAKALMKALEVGHKLQVEAIENVMKQVTFDMNTLRLWPRIEQYEGYEHIDLHGKLKKGTINYTDASTIFAMFHTLVNVRIIRDMKSSGAERVWIDSRPWKDNAST